MMQTLEEIKEYNRQYNKTERGKERRKRYEKSHPEKVKAWRTNWAKNNPERLKELKRNEYHRNKDKYDAYSKKHRLHLNAIRKERYALRRDEFLTKQRVYRAKNIDRVRQWGKNWIANNKALYYFYAIKKRCKKDNIECTITPEWIQQRLDAGVCELTGISFDMSQSLGANSYSIDRINPNGGYTPENCRMIIWSLNRALCNYGQEYMFMVFEKAINNMRVSKGVTRYNTDFSAPYVRNSEH